MNSSLKSLVSINIMVPVEFTLDDQTGEIFLKCQESPKVFSMTLHHSKEKIDRAVSAEAERMCVYLVIQELAKSMAVPENTELQWAHKLDGNDAKA